MKTVVIIPAYNEAPLLPAVLSALKLMRVKNLTLLVVDDGSSDRTFETAQKMDVLVVRHIHNMGLGAALATGMSMARELNADIVGTFDADGQHRVEDLKKALSLIQSGEADVVIGSRLMSSLAMPAGRFFLNWVANILTWALFGVWTTDSQSGLRAFSKKAIETISLKTSRMEVSSEIFAEISRHKLRLREVPIEPVYTPYSRAKGQKSTNSFSIAWKLLLRKLRT